MGDLLGIMILAGSIYLFPESASNYFIFLKFLLLRLLLGFQLGKAWIKIKQVRKLEGIVLYISMF